MNKLSKEELESTFKNVLVNVLEDARLAVIAPKDEILSCLLYTSPSPRDATLSRMPSSA